MQVRRGRRDRVPEADINLNVDARFREARLHDGTDAAVRVVLPNSVHRGIVNIERQTVVIDLRGRDLLDGRRNCGFGGLGQAEEIQIAGRPVPLSDADREQHGSFQHEAVAMLRLRESIQEPLGTVIHERQHEVFLPLL